MAILSPFRYPGAKNKLLPIIMKELSPYIEKTQMYTEPFVGGGSVALEVATQYPQKQIFLNDKDPFISAFWSCVIDDKLHSELNDRITKCHPDIQLFYNLTNSTPTDSVSQAYKAIMLNRLSFSGIIGAGPIGGKDQTSKYKIDCRFNANDLVEKINHCHLLLNGRTTVTNLDVIQCLKNNTNSTIYLDPPYVQAGKSLYIHYMSEMEHIMLADYLSKITYWVLSYDDQDIIRRIYANCVIYSADTNYCINGVKIKWSQKKELLITAKF